MELKHVIPKNADLADLSVVMSEVWYKKDDITACIDRFYDGMMARTLKCLPERKRNIILLSYFMDMSDAEIGELMNVVRTTVYRHRTSTLEELRKMMEEE